MNLIEQLGGYEKTKKHLDSCWCDDENKAYLLEKLLEYRREHNIFELGDQLVFIDGDNDEIMIVQHVWNEVVYGGYCGELPKKESIRHATDEEIKAGRRL